MNTRMIFLVCCILMLNEAFCQLLWHNPHQRPIMESNDIKFFASLQHRADQEYYIVEVMQLLNQEEKDILSAKGIHILEYIPQNHYLIRMMIPQILSLNFPHYKAVGLLESSHKLATNLYFGEVCKGNKNSDAKYMIQWMPSVDFGSIEQELKQMAAFGISSAQRVFSVSAKLQSILELSKKSWIQYIQCQPESGEPEDREGRNLHRVNEIGNNNRENLHYDGTGVKVLVRDDGFVGPHADFKNRITNDVYGDFGTHGDMVSGILCGAGNIDPFRQGMAPSAQLFVIPYQADFLDKTLPLHQQEGVVITNTSYSDGCNAGYTLGTQIVDQQIYENPTLLHVFSAGNANGSDCGYGAGAQWGNITGGHKLAKNALTMANVTIEPQIDPTSSRGPTKDGRMKPELSARGNNQSSTNSNNEYQIGGGTSAASPSAAGCATLLYQVYKQENNGNNPPSALIKAAMMNTATDIGTEGPDYIFGYGIIDVYRAHKLLKEKNYRVINIDNGSAQEIEINVTNSSPLLKVMLYYPESPSSPLSAKALINNADLKVIDPSGIEILPLVLDPTPDANKLALGAKAGIELNNNFEQVVIKNPSIGKYKIVISGTSIPDNKIQGFVLYDIEDKVLRLTSPIGGENFGHSDVTNIYFTTFNLKDTVYARLSVDGGRTWNKISGINLVNRLIPWTTPANVNSDSCLIEITQNNITERSGYFTIGQLVSNLKIVRFCPSGLELSWDKVNKDSFLIYALGDKFMQAYTVTKNNFITIPSFDAIQSKWFSVAGFRDGILSARSKAVGIADSLVRCPLNIDLGLIPSNNNSGVLAFGCDETFVFPNMRVHNRTNKEVTGFAIKANVGGTIFSQNFTQSVKAYDTTNITLNSGIKLTRPGKQNIQLWVEYIGDENSLNDTTKLDVEFVAIKDRNPIYPMKETFDNQIPNTWTYVNPVPISNLAFPKSLTKNNDSSIVVQLYNDNFNLQNLSLSLVSKPVDLSKSIDPYFYFDHAYFRYQNNISSGDTLIITAKELCDAKGLQRVLFYYGGENLTTVPTNAVDPIWRVRSDSAWFSHASSLSDFKGKNIVLDFKLIRGYQGTLLIDNVEVNEKRNKNYFADIKVNPADPCLNKTATITDTSDIISRSMSWDFGSFAIPRYATGKGPFNVRYTSAGVKKILEKLETKEQDVFLSKEINVLANPLASFVATPQSDGSIQFTNNSKFGMTYLWEFGDGKTSTEFEPNHRYDSIGTYSVKLKASNSCNASSFSKNVTIITVNTNDLNDHTTLFPNPCFDYIYIDNSSDFTNYRVISSTGIIIMSDKLQQNKINVKALQDGIYVVELSNRSTKITRQFEKLSRD